MLETASTAVFVDNAEPHLKIYCLISGCLKVRFKASPQIKFFKNNLNLKNYTLKTKPALCFQSESLVLVNEKILSIFSSNEEIAIITK